MEPIKNFEQLTAHLKDQKIRKKIVVVCADDENTEYAIQRALEEGFAEFILVGDTTKLSSYTFLNDYPDYIEMIHVVDPDEAARTAVRLIREGKADILMKGIINTDNLLRAILNKEEGLLPKGRVMSHIAVMQIPTYDKLLFVTDAAVIPRPTLEQREAMLGYAISACHDFGIEKPYVSLIHCSEKVGEKFPHTLDYVTIIRDCKEGKYGSAVIDGPLDVKTSCDKHSSDIKGITSPVCGNADVLMFPNIESGNVFYKTASFFANGIMAGLLVGPICPVILPSRSDSGLSKYYSMAMSCVIRK